MPYRPFSLADAPTTALAGNTAVNPSRRTSLSRNAGEQAAALIVAGGSEQNLPLEKDMNQYLPSMTANVPAKSSTPIWAWAVLSVFALAIMVITLGGLDVLSPSTRAGITDYIVAIGASEPASR